MTSLTYSLVEKNLNFRQFTLMCSRMFGPCVAMRDENMDVPPPEEVKPDPYHKNELATAKKHFAKLDSTPSAERKSYGIKAKKTALDEAKKYRKESLEKETKEVAILQGMLDQVERWAPPTQDHVGVKSFMIQQLTDSIKYAVNGSEYHDKHIASIEAMSPEEFFNNKLESAAKDVKYHSEHWDKEVARAKCNDTWLKALYASLPESK